jgi:hypothetical protein
MKSILSHFIKDKFLSKSLLQLQNDRSKAKLDLFGDPHHNVKYATALCDEMESQGHSVLLLQRDRSYIYQLLERTVLKEEIENKKNKKFNMSAQSKQAFLDKWRVDNTSMLRDGGLGIRPEGEESPKYAGGIFFAPKYSNVAVPHLQQVFQADACHIKNFGKYSIYSCYGTTANCNTFPIIWDRLWQRVQ